MLYTTSQLTQRSASITFLLANMQHLRLEARSSQLRLLDLPDGAIHRICAFLARRPPFTSDDRSHQELPYDLLNFAVTCRRSREYAAALCDSLNFESYTSWRALVSWLNLANSSLRTVRISAMPANIDLPFRQLQLLPPAVVLSTLAYRSFSLKQLDLSGLNLYTPHDAILLASLLKQLRSTLTNLTLLDSGSCLSHVSSAVAAAGLKNLVSFTYLSLRVDCGNALNTMLLSFNTEPLKMTKQSECLTPTSSQSCLSQLHLHFQDSAQEGEFFTEHSPLSAFCPSLTTMTLASEFESPMLVPDKFIASFPSLCSVTLKDMVLDHEAVVYMLTNLPRFNKLYLDGCLILHDDESGLHTVSASFSYMVAVSAPVLTSLWIPSRCFSVPELKHLQYATPPLESLALAVGQSAVNELSELCLEFSATLKNLRLAVISDETSPVDLSEIQQVHILGAVKNVPQLRSLHLVSVYLKTFVLQKMLQHLGGQLRALYMEVSPYKSSEEQVDYAIQLLDFVGTYNHGLNFFCLENEVLRELPKDSLKAKRLEDGVQSVVNALPYLNSTNLRSLLSLWIGDEEENVEGSKAMIEKTELVPHNLSA